MHDIDRTFMEAEDETFEFDAEDEGGDAHAYEGEYEDEAQDGEVLDEGEVEQLATELLSLNGEEELDHFLGSLIKKAANAAGKFVKTPMGRQLGGMLKSLAGKALPVAGSALGNMVVPGLGGMLGGSMGSNLANQAGALFGLELEGLSNEDQQFEVAKQFVRLAADATKSAVTAPPAQPMVDAVKTGLTQAAQKYAPGLLQGHRGAGVRGQSGRWVRRGNKIVLYGL